MRPLLVVFVLLFAGCGGSTREAVEPSGTVVPFPYVLGPRLVDPNGDPV